MPSLPFILPFPTQSFEKGQPNVLSNLLPPPGREGVKVKHRTQIYMVTSHRLADG